MKELTNARIAENLEILSAETRFLRIIVTGLLKDASPQAKEYAAELIKRAAEDNPRFAVNEKAEDFARLGITEMASSWISLLSS